MDLPAIVFHLTWGKTGFAIWHVCSLVNDQYDVTKLGFYVASCLDEWQIANCVIINTVEVCEATVIINLSHVRAHNTSIGASVDESAIGSAELA